MKKEGYYTTGQFAEKAHSTVRMIRFYDQKGILKPSVRTESGARLYTEEDFTKLQQILLFKYLGFSLEDIREMTLASADQQLLLETMELQKKLIRKRIEEMKAVEDAIDNTEELIRTSNNVDYSGLMKLIHMTAMENTLNEQYRDAANINARITLHHNYSENPQGWFPWIFEQCAFDQNMSVLEIGCGNGALWHENKGCIPEGMQIILSDRSSGMVQDAMSSLQNDIRFAPAVFDCHAIPYPDNTFDRVIANHLLFYCEDIPKVLSECRRVLKPGGMLICSTYGKKHMQEITSLVQGFNKEIVLSADALYEKFGLENGKEQMEPYFSDIECIHYDDAIILQEAGPLISYILSCHGNQNRVLLDKYKEFRDYVQEHTSSGFRITKDAGIFKGIKK